jgi:hypothetical protein
MHDEHLAELFTDRTQLTVARTLPVPFAGAIAAAVGLTRPPLDLERTWHRDLTGPLDRTDLAPARVRGRMQAGRRIVSVEIELAPWADGVCELLIRPDTRAPHRWSGRRRRTWYAAAHPVVDALRQQLLDAQPSVRRPAPVLRSSHASEQLFRRRAG